MTQTMPMTCCALASYSLTKQMSDESDSHVQNILEEVLDANPSLGASEECFTSYEKQLKELSLMFRNMMRILETTQATTSQPQLASHNINHHETDNNHNGNDNMVPQQFTQNSAQMQVQPENLMPNAPTV